MANVAQLVEPRFVVPVVVSSSLIVRPTFFLIYFPETIIPYFLQMFKVKGYFLDTPYFDFVF